ncbi:MAG: dynamin family protein [Xenococcaceae cyanobacterium MO_167.B27]|nr:dynamin family protein [Xenococcaceae cyanobacterium MO_167.B27]
MVESAPSTKTRNKSPKIENLQQEVINLLDDIGSLIDHTQASLTQDASGNKYSQFQQQLVEASQNVADLQLKMAIVAPMKAGKSTIINAIAGQELLPSCATAMTTLPTEIAFSTKLREPILTLEAETLNIFQDIYQDIKQQIANSGIESLQQKLARYPHLLDLLEAINTADFPFSNQIEGRAAINKALNHLNHIIRLYCALEPLKDPLAQFTEVPCITTPFLGISGISPAKTLGNLVIVDTPGPNEAGENLRLTTVVEEQLRRSSIVLIVLDYTQLNNEAAEAIKKQVKPVLELIGQDNLYIVVNKVDQRRKGDMTREQVRDFVIADLELNGSDVSNRIFEVSAIRAFAATQFLLEVQQNPRIKLLEIASLETIAQEVFGIDWDEQIEDFTVKFLAKKALKLWKKSGFSPFLQEAISTLMATAAPRCLMSALNLSRYRLLELKDDLSLRSNAINQNTEKLQQEIKALESDLEYLETCSSNLKEIGEIKNRLHENLETILADLKTQAKFSLEDYFNEAEYQRGDLVKKADIKTRELLLKNIGDFDLLPKWIADNLKSNLEHKTAATIPFTTEKEAKIFTQKALAWSRNRLDTLILTTRKNIEVEIEQASTTLIDCLTKETQPIIERAKVRLQTNFEIDLRLPTPEIGTENDLEVNQNFVKTKTRLVEGDYEERIVKKRAWYYWFGIVPFYSTETYQKPYKQENYYTVSLQELVNEINIHSENFIENVKVKVIQHLEGNIQEQVDDFFAQLDDYLSSYLKNIQQAQSDHQLSLEQRQELYKQIDALVPETTTYLQKTDKYLEITQQFLGKLKL